jgi:hypothetical protein
MQSIKSYRPASRTYAGIAALFVFGALASASALCAPPLAGDVNPEHASKMGQGLEIFKQHVRPVLLQRCLRCHGGKTTEGEFTLIDREQLLHGGTSGPAIVAHSAKDSLLCKLITHSREPHMPHQAAKLAPDVIAHFADWIDCGAPYDKPLLDTAKTQNTWTQKRIPDSARSYWAFQPLRHVTPPSLKQDNWSRTPIDRFILEKQRAAGIEPNAPAEKRTLIRRLYFDVIGLPPAPADVETFLNDPAPDAYERLVDRLLAGPGYGERWGRHWLDLARFAESHGFEQDYDRPFAYHYRDFVIQALNADLPYDTFVRWQLAGDEVQPENRLALAATGFLAAGVHSTQITQREVEKQRYDELDDMAATTGTAMLGLTFGCARCHDHKFDPIPQGDYYRLVATFTTTVRSDYDFNLDPIGFARAQAAFQKEHAPFVSAVRKFECEELPARQSILDQAWQIQEERFHWAALDVVSRRGPKLAGLAQWVRTRDPKWLRLKHAVNTHLRKAPKPSVAKILVASEGLTPIRLHTQGADFSKATYFLNRGDPDQKEGVATPGFPQIFTTGPQDAKHWQVEPPKGSRTTYRRHALADWISDIDHGAGALLARVIVNRLWQHHLGRGIVATPSEFGTRGERPTHPELLDWLAAELIRNGWRLKPLHRLILTSAVYRESATFDAAKARVDGSNQLVWRRLRARLEAEAVRDSLLTVSGSLDSRMFGPGSLKESSRRRSIYFTIKHSSLIPMMQVFDAPDAIQGVGDRPTTTIAPQALLLMNNANVRGYALAMAKKVALNDAIPLCDAVKAGYLMATSHPPNDDELTACLAFLNRQIALHEAAGKKNAKTQALADWCQALMCLNEFVYVE